MFTYQLMNTMVAEHRAQLESDAATSRLTKRRTARSWFRRSAGVATAHSETTPVRRTVPAAGTPAFHDWASAVGHQLTRDGVRAVETHMRALGRLARDLGVATVAAGVLADRHAPEVARARAFDRVVVALGTFTAASSIGTVVAA